MSKILTTKMINTGGRGGSSISPDNSWEFKIDMAGKPGTTNPEQLFAAGYAACFNGALAHVMKLKKVDYPSKVSAEVTLHAEDDKGFFISVVLEIHIEGVSIEEAWKLVEETDTVCPYSKAIKGNVEVELKVV